MATREASAHRACPVDGTALVPQVIDNVTVDRCPRCRGVWLDRGELDKIIERSARFEATQGPPTDRRPYPDDDDYRQGHYRKRKSFWSDLFD